MLRIGLTGGIGAGKSAVAARLADHGAVVIDSDRIAREVVEPGTAGLAAVVGAFGDEVLLPDGTLDRERLGALVFADDAERARLNAIVHPLVGARAAELVAVAPAGSIVVHDVPLLVENGLAPGYHLVLVVEAQATDEQRRAVADLLVVNAGSLDDLRAEVDAVWSGRLAPYAANLAAGRAAPGDAGVAPYDPAWPAQYARAEARLRTVLGERAVRIDHVGSTAVPGLAAEDVLDVQVSVGSLADADGALAALPGTGWVPDPEITADQAPPNAEPGTGQWAKRFARHADPGRPARLHVRVDGAANQRLALLFRDFLRAIPAEAAAYPAGATGPDAGGSATIDAGLDTVLRRAQRWARDASWHP
jgi:dephospho-CoA kinase